MEGRERPRRPAILDPRQAESLWGDSDPALASEAAHATANAVVYGPGHRADDEDLASRVGAIIVAEGLDEIAGLWYRSPATTLPGALWRLYLLRAWIERAPDTVAQRFEEGRQGADHSAAPAPAELADQLDQLFAGTSDPGLADVLERSATFLRTLAAAPGEAHWPGPDGTATEVTGRTDALDATAAELDGAAERARAGTLD